MSPQKNSSTPEPGRQSTENRQKRRSDHVPAVIAHAVIDVSANGTLEVTLDGAPVPPPQTGPWLRDGFGELLDHLTAERSRSVRIDVHESDGSTFTEIITATPKRAASPDRARKKTPKTKRSRAARRLELTGEGFIPGEHVAVAVILTHAEADSAGAVKSGIKVDDLKVPGQAEVLLLGRVSGRRIIRGTR